MGVPVISPSSSITAPPVRGVLPRVPTSLGSDTYPDFDAGSYEIRNRFWNSHLEFVLNGCGSEEEQILLDQLCSLFETRFSVGERS